MLLGNIEINVEIRDQKFASNQFTIFSNII